MVIIHVSLPQAAPWQEGSHGGSFRATLGWALCSPTPSHTAQIPVRVNSSVTLGKYTAKEPWEACWTFTPLVINQAEVSCGWAGSTFISTCFLLCCCLGTISRTANPASKQVADSGKPPDRDCCAFPFVVYIFACWMALKGGWPGIYCGSGKGCTTKPLFLISETGPTTWPTMEPGRRWAGGPSASLWSGSPAWGRGATSDHRTRAKCLSWHTQTEKQPQPRLLVAAQCWPALQVSSSSILSE